MPIDKRVEQCIGTLVYKYFQKKVPSYIEDIFIPKVSKYNIRNPDMLTRPLCKTSNGQKAISFMAPKIWADIPRKVKEKESITAFKHEFKKHYFKD